MGTSQDTINQSIHTVAYPESVSETKSSLNPQAWLWALIAAVSFAIYSQQPDKSIKNSKAIKRTGFAERMNSGATPRYFEYLKGMPCLEIFSKMGMYTLVRVLKTQHPETEPIHLRLLQTHRLKPDAFHWCFR